MYEVPILPSQEILAHKKSKKLVKAISKPQVNTDYGEGRHLIRPPPPKSSPMAKQMATRHLYCGYGHRISMQFLAQLLHSVLPRRLWLLVTRLWVLVYFPPSYANIFLLKRSSPLRSLPLMPPFLSHSYSKVITSFSQKTFFCSSALLYRTMYFSYWCHSPVDSGLCKGKNFPFSPMCL